MKQVKRLKILVYVPHFDDEVIIAGGTLATLAKDHEIWLVGALRTDRGFAELVAAEMKFHTIDVKQDPLEAIKIAEPDIVFTTHPRDLTYDHSECAKKVQSAVWLSEVYGIQKSPILLHGGTDFWCPSKIPHVFFPISEKAMNLKLECLKLYDRFPSSVSTRDLVKFPEGLKVEAIRYGRQYGFPYAEAFELGCGNLSLEKVIRSLK